MEARATSFKVSSEGVQTNQQGACCGDYRIATIGCNVASATVPSFRRPMSDTALADALADRYRIDRELGAGGMATV